MRTRCVFQWSVAALLLPAGLVLSSFAQAPESGKVGTNDAKEKAKLIEQGQLNLQQATALAEKHSRGTALEGRSRIQLVAPAPEGREPTKPGPKDTDQPAGMGQEEPPGKTDPKDRPKLPPPKEKDTEAVKRLVYEITCFVQDRVQDVRVDGLAKKVMDAVEEPKVGSEKPKQ